MWASVSACAWLSGAIRLNHVSLAAIRAGKLEGFRNFTPCLKLIFFGLHVCFLPTISVFHYFRGLGVSIQASFAPLVHCRDCSSLKPAGRFLNYLKQPLSRCTGYLSGLLSWVVQALLIVLTGRNTYPCMMDHLLHIMRGTDLRYTRPLHIQLSAKLRPFTITHRASFTVRAPAL